MLTHHKLNSLFHFSSVQSVTLDVLSLYSAPGWLDVILISIILINNPISLQCIL